MPLTLGAYACRVRITPVSPGTTGGDNDLNYNVSTHVVTGAGPINVVRNVTITRMSDAQFTGLLNYLALIKAQADTASIETAITAAL